MCNKILVAVDSSALSRRTLIYAIELAQSIGARLTVLFINQIIPRYYGGELGPAKQYFPLEGYNTEKILNAMLDDLSIRSDSIAKRFAVGNPVQLIVMVAEEEKANLIVIGSRGSGLLTGLLSGSVSGLVIKYAPCPVLIVK